LENTRILRPTDDEQNNRVMKYMMLRTSQSLSEWHRHKECQLAPIPTARTVDIRRTGDNRLYFTGLCKCGSVWECAVCSLRIAAKRAEQISEILATVSANKGHYSMITLTTRHRRSDSLKSVLGRVKAGHRAIKSGRAYQAFKKGHGVTGSLTATEITYGDAGWHAHLHELLIHSTQSIDIPIELEDRYMSITDSVKGVGLKVTNGNSFLAEYITKFGRLPAQPITNQLALEVAMSHTKKSRSDAGQSAFSILAEIALTDSGKPELWREYATTMKGTKQLSVSRNLPVSDLPEGEGEEDETDQILARIPLAIWHRLRQAGFNQGQLLNAVQNGELEEYLCSKIGDAGISIEELSL